MSDRPSFLAEFALERVVERGFGFAATGFGERCDGAARFLQRRGGAPQAPMREVAHRRHADQLAEALRGCGARQACGRCGRARRRFTRASGVRAMHRVRGRHAGRASPP